MGLQTTPQTQKKNAGKATNSGSQRLVRNIPKMFVGARLLGRQALKGAHRVARHSIKLVTDRTMLELLFVWNRCLTQFHWDLN